MKPNLSVTYNSSTKTGLAGYGFDLTGLSIISRIPSDRFHDGISTAIDFTSHDHFALDGQRLMYLSYSSDTETEFRVTNYNYSQTKLIHKATLTVGDFNGDGLADFIATPENNDAGWKGWKLFISHGTYFEQVASGTWNFSDDNIEQVVCGDFNGDVIIIVQLRSML